MSSQFNNSPLAKLQRRMAALLERQMENVEMTSDSSTKDFFCVCGSINHLSTNHSFNCHKPRHLLNRFSHFSFNFTLSKMYGWYPAALQHFAPLSQEHCAYTLRFCAVLGAPCERPLLPLYHKGEASV